MVVPEVNQIVVNEKRRRGRGGEGAAERRKLKQRLNYLATRDELTGLHNRRAFAEKLKKIKEEPGNAVSLMLAHINGLRLINRMHGAEGGDLILLQTAELLRSACGCGDRQYLARINGNEFALIFYEASRELEDKACAVIREECRRTEHHRVPLSISYGIADSWGEDAVPVRELYEQARLRLGYSKMLSTQNVSGAILTSLKEALRAWDVETFDHVRRVERMAVGLGRRYGLNHGELNRLHVLAAMHDIGKIAVPDAIINKPGALDEKEWKVMQGHCEAGMQIALATYELEGIALEILSHHERWDGLGYPYGKKGEEIPLLARMICVVDSYDAMTAYRPYQRPLTKERAIAELLRGRGAQFDPRLVDLFVAELEET